jgi:hypothetical protein
MTRCISITLGRGGANATPDIFPPENSISGQSVEGEIKKNWGNSGGQGHMYIKGQLNPISLPPLVT